MPLFVRPATASDIALLGELNHQLIRDEGHHNPMTVPELQERMRGWLLGEYTAVIFENETGVVAYALYREEPGSIYLRQLFVQRNCRRKGFGKETIVLLRSQFWPVWKRLTVEVLTANAAAISFYRELGFRDYTLTLEIPGYSVADAGSDAKSDRISFAKPEACQHRSRWLRPAGRHHRKTSPHDSDPGGIADSATPSGVGISVTRKPVVSPAAGSTTGYGAEKPPAFYKTFAMQAGGMAQGNERVWNTKGLVQISRGAQQGDSLPVRADGSARTRATSSPGHPNRVASLKFVSA